MSAPERRAAGGPSRLARLVAAGGIGVAAGSGTAAFVPWQGAVLLGWLAAALSWLGPMWLTVSRMDPPATSAHATREDPHGPVADLLLVGAAVGSLGAVVWGVLAAAHASGSDKVVLLAAGLGAIVASWGVVHTVFTLRYASLYYGAGRRGVDFNEDEPPTYADFAYLAFTIGMTYQVSDTDLTSRAVRHTALRHALLSYLLGTVIIAASINLAAGLAH